MPLDDDVREMVEQVRLAHSKGYMPASVTELLGKVAQVLERLAAENAALREDGERLRYVLLHDQPYKLGDPPYRFAYFEQLGNSFETETDAIDAARREEKP